MPRERQLTRVEVTAEAGQAVTTWERDLETQPSSSPAFRTGLLTDGGSWMGEHFERGALAGGKMGGGRGTTRSSGFSLRTGSGDSGELGAVGSQAHTLTGLITRSVTCCLGGLAGVWGWG